jgi:hypothetical protein
VRTPVHDRAAASGEQIADGVDAGALAQLPQGRSVPPELC